MTAYPYCDGLAHSPFALTGHISSSVRFTPGSGTFCPFRNWKFNGTLPMEKRSPGPVNKWNPVRTPSGKYIGTKNRHLGVP